MAFLVREDVVAVEEYVVALAADEGLISGHGSQVLFTVAVGPTGPEWLLVLAEDELLVDFGPAVEGHPDAAELGEGAKLGPLQFVDVVMEGVAGFDEFGGLAFDGQLDLAEDRVVEASIDEDVVGAVLESVLDPDYPEAVPVLLAAAEGQDLVIHLQDLVLAGGQLAPHQVAHFEGYQVGWERPI